MDTRTEIRNFIEERLRDRGDDGPFSDGDSLLLSGRIDSMTVLEILSFLETKFNYIVDEHLFDQVDYDSIESILALLDKTGG